MLNKSERLNRQLFNSYFKVGKRIQQKYSTIIVAPADIFLTAVVVSKKVSLKAVVRNRLRRRFYALIKVSKKSEKITGVYIFIIKPEAKNLTRQQFKTFIGDEVGSVIK